ncbi:DUF305 domain-containing protein [Nocardia higoensis]|uniref:DUF305 domain-containing protein n=1 Tax=Nocardia higoensis TaxID=228599 RepID=A0ABS0DH87_9NOCA|nr:DUF305 domain-containing protein [Nocardia higoensis]MBF6357833.1 DUF305 domain-containing protein [Nocardia higoensis]
MSGKTLPSAVLAMLAAAVVLTGCGDDDSADGGDTGAAATSVSASAAPTTSGTNAPADVHNDADITFAQEMIPHHRQAVMMADMAISRSTDPQLQDLAKRIQAAQEPEIATMTGWLQAWGAPVTGGGHGGPHGGGSPMMSSPMMPGMMSDEQMSHMGAATGAEFDQMWLNGMIAHHEGAIEMSRTELAEGANPDAKALAQQIIDSQQAEIDEMRKMLQG